MKLTFNNRKHIWTSDTNCSSCWFIFDYKDIETINKLSKDNSLFKLKVGDTECNATINQSSSNPISVETLTGTHKFKGWEAYVGFSDVTEVMIKIDVFIGDAICGLIRTENIKIIIPKENKDEC